MWRLLGKVWPESNVPILTAGMSISDPSSLRSIMSARPFTFVPLVHRNAPSLSLKTWRIMFSCDFHLAAVLCFQMAGDFLRFNSLYHGMVLESGFDEEGNFVFIPFDNLDKISEYFRRMIISMMWALTPKVREKILIYLISDLN